MWAWECSRRTISRWSWPRDGSRRIWRSSPRPHELWAARRQLLSQEDIKLRHRELGELYSLATVSRPIICARLATITSRVDSLRGSGVYRINDRVGSVHVWRKAAVLRYASSCPPGAQARGDIDGRMRARGEEIQCGAVPFAGWSGAAYGDQSAQGRCRVWHIPDIERALPFFAVDFKVHEEVGQKHPRRLSLRI